MAKNRNITSLNIEVCCRIPTNTSNGRPQDSREFFAGSYDFGVLAGLRMNILKIMECLGEDVLFAIFSFLDVRALCCAS